jgi:ATPase family associated with various cellular activities (AAA)
MPSALEGLLPVLRRLDALLAGVVVLGQATDEAGEPDPWRGLVVHADEAAQLLTRPPGAPRLATSPWSREALSAAAAPDTALTRLGRAFGLSPFELDVVLIALAPELDLRYERIYAFLQDDVTRRRPTVDLALGLLCGSADERLDRLAAFTNEATLVRTGLLHLAGDPGQPDPPGLARLLQLDEQVVRTLLDPAGDLPVPFGCRLVEPLPGHRPSGLPSHDRLVELFAKGGADDPRPYLHGPPVAVRDAVGELAAAAGRPLVVLDLALATERDRRPDLADLLQAALRCAQLRAAAICMERVDALAGDDRYLERDRLQQALASFPGPAVLTGTAPGAALGRPAPALVDVAVAPPTFEATRDRWRFAAGEAGIDLDDTGLDVLASRFPLGHDQVDSVVAAVAGSARWHGASPGVAELLAAGQAAAGRGLDALAQRISVRVHWDDLVLPADQGDQLRELCRRVERRHIVLGRWGFEAKLATGLGVSALFAGPPGTGKTMAASAIATELGLPLYAIDLARVVSKYIGETEQRLERIFDEAETTSAILLFDEADALFGKRSEVKDAHDRYANIEIAYLLQRMEAYEGVSILATNLRRNLDEAFLRRLAFVVEFPHPDQAQRLEIWRKIWPAETPLDPDLDLAFMARQFELAGGYIRNVALNAAFLAAADGRMVTMRHLLAATRREFQKLGRVPVAEDFGPYAHLVSGRRR